MSLNRHPDTLAVELHLRPCLLPLAGVLVLLFALSCANDPAQGRVILSGSSTLAPLVSQALTKYRALHPRVETRVEAIGSDAGLEGMIRYSDADLALVSRPVNDQDQAAAQAAGKTLVVLPLAWDAVCLVVPPSNTWARSLDRTQAARAFTTARLWSDLDPSWPATPIHRFVLGPRSGTADVFVGALLQGRKADLYVHPGTQVTEDDRILARGIGQVDGALGFLGWTTVQESGPGLRALALDGVLPTAATIGDRSYGMTRALSLVATREGLAANPAARALVRFLYDNSSVLASSSGLVPLSPAEETQVRTVLDNP